MKLIQLSVLSLIFCTSFYMPLAGQKSIQYFQLLRHVDYEASWSPDSKSICFISNRNGPFNLYITDSAGKDLKRLTFSDAEDDMPVFSPDGKKIAYVSNKAGNNDIYVIDIETLLESRITTTQADDIHPCWSPNGEYILYNSSINSKNLSDPDRYDLVLRDTKNGVDEMITFEGINTYANFSSDGKQIIYRKAKNSKSQLMLMDLNTKRSIQLTDGNYFDGWPTWSHDNSSIYFASDRAGTFHIFLLNVFTNQLKQLTTGNGRFTNPRIASDGKKLLFTGRKDGELNTTIFINDASN